MKIYLIKRNKLIHCGLKIRHWGEVITISVCNQRWVDNDIVTKGDSTEVTCVKCLKKLATADSDGCVKLGK